MPTETFLRLPEEKRGRFMEAAWAEFTRVKFADASINQIVRQAGIPRGSFYQYFAGKEELFLYLLEDVKVCVVGFFGDLLRQTDGDIFQLQMAVYDEIVRCEEPRPLMVRCFQVLQVNPGIDLQKLMAGMLQSEVPPELMEKIRVSSLARQDKAYVRRVFLMTLGVLGRSLMDTLLQPERMAEFRQEMEAQLEIIQYGCLLPERAANTSIRRNP
ncbi:MAG: TetR/AcrR family transcriptional regulator [Oscillibacter sp.]|nr:TetR/AcrR family transcriptional regulator [Oscillibacter sp.]